jgi:hypothetical protein
MGLSFHYKGALQKPQYLKPLIEEVTDIAKANHWKHHLFEESFPNDTFTVGTYNDSVYGICVTPPECETVCFTFFSNGRMGAFYNLELSKAYDSEYEDEYLSVKTQFAGPEIHIQLLTIFDYLNKKYFENFDLTDEGNYWETKNKTLLLDTFSKYTNLIDGFGSLLESIPLNEGENIQDYLMRIAEIIHQRNKDKE